MGMSNSEHGVVSFVKSNQWEDPKTKEKITLYSFALGEFGVYYNLGRNSHGIKKGDEVKFSFARKPGRNGVERLVVDGSSVEVVSNSNTVTSDAKKFSRDDYWSNKEARDVEKDKRVSLNAAYNTAIHMTKAALDAGILTLDKARKADGKRVYDGFSAFVDQEARRLYGVYYNAPKAHSEMVDNQSNAVRENGSDPGFDIVDGGGHDFEQSDPGEELFE